MVYNYSEVTYRLFRETAIVVFRKKDESIRVMLCTRNITTAEKLLNNGSYAAMQLCGHDKRCTIQTGAIAAIDMIIEEVRSFKVDRILSVTYLGEIFSKQELDAAVEVVKSEQDRWKDFDSFDDIQKAVLLNNLNN